MSDPLAVRRRVLQHENLPRQLAGEVAGHDVATVRTQGWTGVVNGELLRLAEAGGFDVFVTGDRNLEYQQTLAGASIRRGGSLSPAPEDGAPASTRACLE